MYFMLCGGVKIDLDFVWAKAFFQTFERFLMFSPPGKNFGFE